MRDWGRTARVPALWMWSENDHYFAPGLGREMFDAYVAGGAPASFQLNSAFGEDGHELLTQAPADLWWGPVAAFLASLGLPTQAVVALPPMPPLTAPPWLNVGCRDRLAAYAQLRTTTKAFAITSIGQCQWKIARTDREAQAGALDACRARWGVCSLYAVGQTVLDGRL
jgi:hypothetical protein